MRDIPTVGPGVAQDPATVPGRIRGTALCFWQSPGHTGMETALARAGMTILRARNALHALSLARTAAPDVILLDVLAPAESGPSIVADLQRTRGTASIPVVALVPELSQDSIGASGLRGIACVITQGTSPEALRSEIAQLIMASDRRIRRDDASTASIDAVFSELGSRKRRRRAAASASLAQAANPMDERPGGNAPRIRRIDESPHPNGSPRLSGIAATRSV